LEINQGYNKVYSEKNKTITQIFKSYPYII